MELKIVRCHPDAKLPYKREEDGCYDLYACFDENELMWEVGDIKLVGTGLKTYFSNEYFIQLHEKSSAFKQRLLMRSGIIDSGYRGEIFVCLENNTDKPIEISKSINDYEITEDYIRIPYNKSICQFSLQKVEKSSILEISQEELDTYKSERGEGAIGSTGK